MVSVEQLPRKRTISSYAVTVHIPEDYEHTTGSVEVAVADADPPGYTLKVTQKMWRHSPDGVLIFLTDVETLRAIRDAIDKVIDRG